MPPGQEWRTGADEATTLKTDKPLKFGTLAVPAGAVTLYTVPGDKEWQLVVSKKTGQWGIPYPKGEDLGRADESHQGGQTGRTAHDRDRRHARWRRAPRRVGNGERQRAVHRRLSFLHTTRRGRNNPSPPLSHNPPPAATDPPPILI